MLTSLRPIGLMENLLTTTFLISRSQDAGIRHLPSGLAHDRTPPMTISLSKQKTLQRHATGFSTSRSTPSSFE